MENNTYRIETITDILNLAPDKRERFLLDFKAWLEFVDGLKPLADAGIVGIQPLMIWVDDGRVGEISALNLIDKDTGDHTTIEF